MRGLREVYWDAVFHPLLRPQDFRQEGWRLVKNAEGHSALQGVVLNEMKGVLGDAATVFSYETTKIYYKGTPYGFTSGGDPLAIPALQLEDLHAFHRTHYAPSLARIYLYGPPNSMNEHMAFLSERLAGIPAPRQTTHIFPVSSYNPPLGQRFAIQGPVDNLLPEDRQARFAMTYALPALSEKTLPLMCALQVLGTLLLDGPGAPLYRALLEGGRLGDSYVAGVGLDAATRYPTFTIGVAGTSSTLFNTIETAIKETLQSQLNSPFDSDRLSGILHTLEVQQRHVTADLGLRLAQSLFLPWLHHLNPLVALQQQERTDALKSRLVKSSQFLNDLLDKYFINAPYAVFTMEADSNFIQSRQAKEEKLIERLDATSGTNGNSIDTLEEDIVEDLSMLPCLSPSVISKQPPGHVAWIRSLNAPENIPMSTTGTQVNSDFTEQKHSISSFPIMNSNGCHLFEREDITNDLWYLRAIYTSTQGPWLPFLLACFGRQPTELLSVTQVDNALQSTIADFGIAWHRSTSILDSNTRHIGILVQISALTTNADASLHLCHEILSKMRFDPICTQTVLTNLTHDGITALPDHAISYAKRSAIAGLPAEPTLLQQRRLEEAMFGLSQLCFLRHLKDNLSIENVISTLQIHYDAFREALVLQRAALVKSLGSKLQINKMSLDTHALKSGKVLYKESVQESEDQKDLKVTANTISNISQDNFDMLLPMTAWGTLVDLQYAVSYTALVVDMAKLLEKIAPCGWLHPANPMLTLISTIISDKFLHAHVREKNGAYGSGLQYDAFHGLLHFYSYRDPMPFTSITLFRASLAWFLRASESSPCYSQDFSMCQGKDDKFAIDAQYESLLDSILIGDLAGTAHGALTEQDLIEAKLSVFKDLDKPKNVEDKGLPEFYHDISVEMLEARRTAILKASLPDLHRTARLLFLPLLIQQGSKANDIINHSVPENDSQTCHIPGKIHGEFSLEELDMWKTVSRAVIIGGGTQENIGVTLSRDADWSIIADLKL
jgi:presequence protease